MKIISHLMGGMGNQMFQYALGRKLALTLPGKVDFKLFFEDRYKLAERTYSLHGFNIRSSLADKNDLKKLGPDRRIRRRLKKLFHLPLDQHVVRESRSFIFQPSIFNLQTDAYLIGFWQSYKYFDDIRSYLVEDFSLVNQEGLFEEQLEAIRSSQCSVSLHIRRSDYLNPLNLFQPLPMPYYLSSIERLKQTIGAFDLFVFTDDPGWAKENLSVDHNHVGTITIVSRPDLKDYEELILMSKCNHHIIANSSFSWWGAWLSKHEKKMVIAPKSWNGTNLDVPLTDLIPAEWVMMG